MYCPAAVRQRFRSEAPNSVAAPWVAPLPRAGRTFGHSPARSKNSPIDRYANTRKATGPSQPVGPKTTISARPGSKAGVVTTEAWPSKHKPAPAHQPRRNGREPDVYQGSAPARSSGGKYSTLTRPNLTPAPYVPPASGYPRFSPIPNRRTAHTAPESPAAPAPWR